MKLVLTRNLNTPPATSETPTAPLRLADRSKLTLTERHHEAESNGASATIATTANESMDLFNRGQYYFQSDEVDTAATPVAEWSIDTDNIALGELVILRLKIYVSNEGHVDLYDLQSSTANESNTKALLRTIEKTAFAPAIIGGRQVPSVREIEITIDTPMNQQGQ